MIEGGRHLREAVLGVKDEQARLATPTVPYNYEFAL
jgi:hypothetical protein